jgi:EmrB/QacA subfamily drug resistance transporter
MIRFMKRRDWTLVAAIIGSGMVILDGFVVNLALPSISRDLHAHFTDLQWIVDGFLLSLSSLILIGGSLGDIYGRKRIYLIGLWGFIAVSLLCALAPNAQFLVASRVLQGVFGALLVPGGLAIINTNFPKEERGKAIGRWSAWLAIVVPIGPVVGGYIINVSSWRWIFLINLPLGLLCGYLAIRSFEESHDEQKRRVDVAGAAMAAALLAGITYGLIEGPGSHWGVKSLAPLIVGLVLVPIFIRYESRQTDPMVRLSLFQSRNFSGANVMTFAMYGALAGFTFILPIYLQTKIGYSALRAGLCLLPVSILLLTLSSRMGALCAEYGPRFFITSGPLIAALGILSLVNYKPGDSFITYLLPRVILFGIGMALLVAPLTATVMSSVDNSSSGIASGINNAVSRVASLVVIAVLGLAGVGDTFRFTLILCAILAASAGVLAYLMIQNQAKPFKVKA